MFTSDRAIHLISMLTYTTASSTVLLAVLLADIAEPEALPLNNRVHLMGLTPSM